MLLKVCGLTRPEDVLLCHHLGVDFTGFIFAAKSPRRITPEQAAALPRGTARRVGVFTASGEDALSDIAKTVHLAALDMVQLHGAHDAAFCGTLAQMIGPERIIKVLWPEKIWSHRSGGAIEGAPPPQTPPAGDRIPCTPFIGCTGETMGSQIAHLREAIPSEMALFAPYCGLFLLDAGQSGGGSGHTLQWRALQGLRAPRPWLLAGGLSPDNMESALAECAPDGLDLNSGLETAPGVKDPARLAAAVRIVRGNSC